MRLIDADALIDDCKKYLNKLNPSRDGKECTRIHWLIGILSDAPTIEPKTEAKVPRWVAEDRFVKGSYFVYPHCPKCNSELATGQCYCSVCGQHIDWDKEEGEADG